jgi:hypothetical protein
MRVCRFFVCGMVAALSLTAAASGQHEKTGSLPDLPQAAQSTISAALGQCLSEYAVLK